MNRSMLGCTARRVDMDAARDILGRPVSKLGFPGTTLFWDVLQTGCGHALAVLGFHFLRLRRYAEQAVNELTLPNHIALRYPPNLTLPNLMHGFIPVDRP